MRTQYTAKISDLRLSPEQADLALRRVKPFADMHGVTTRPLIHLMQESYLQGIADATDAMKIEHDKLKAENDWLLSKLSQFCGAA